MATLLINIDDDLLQELLAGASAENSSLDEYIGQLLLFASGAAPGVKSKSATDSDMLAEAIKRASKKGKDAQFRLQELFDQTEWSSVSPTSFGRVFHKEVEGKKIAEHIGKDAQNKAIYKRI